MKEILSFLKLWNMFEIANLQTRIEKEETEASKISSKSNGKSSPWAIFFKRRRFPNESPFLIYFWELECHFSFFFCWELESIGYYFSTRSHIFSFVFVDSSTRDNSWGWGGFIRNLFMFSLEAMEKQLESNMITGLDVGWPVWRLRSCRSMKSLNFS